MPRTGRIVIPNCPHHVIHRGHNRKAVFISDDDYNYYLRNLLELKKELGCRVYSYCLMTNHVHLIVDPGDTADSLGILMKKVAGRQTRYVNTVRKSSGTLWEGRYRSSPICKDSYLLLCSRYIEMNPVRAAMVTDPSGYVWSSYHEKVEGPADIIDPDPAFLGLGDDVDSRKRKYREWVLSAVPVGEWKQIHNAVQQGHLTGGQEFQQAVEERLGFRLEHKNQGRPRKR